MWIGLEKKAHESVVSKLKETIEEAREGNEALREGNEALEQSKDEAQRLAAALRLQCAAVVTHNTQLLGDVENAVSLQSRAEADARDKGSKLEEAREAICTLEVDSTARLDGAKKEAQVT